MQIIVDFINKNVYTYYMEELILQYISKQYYVDTEENLVRLISDDNIVFLFDLGNEISDVFGVDKDEVFMVITKWGLSEGLTNLDVQWGRRLIKMDAGYVYAPYIPLQVTPPDIQGQLIGVSSRYARTEINGNYLTSLRFSG